MLIFNYWVILDKRTTSGKCIPTLLDQDMPQMAIYLSRLLQLYILNTKMDQEAPEAMRSLSIHPGRT